MLCAIDIDATIATDRNGYARYLNNALGLSIQEDIIEQLESYDDFHILPAVQGYLQGPDQRDHYWSVYESLQREPEVQKQLIPILGAVEALNDIALANKIIYVTCRQPGAETITQEWLGRYNFPSPEQITICPHYYDKYLTAYEQAKPREKIIVIDDHAEEMIKSFFVMAKTHMNIATSLYRRFAIVAFGHTEPPTFRRKLPFPVMALRSWHPDDLALMEQEQMQLRAG